MTTPEAPPAPAKKKFVPPELDDETRAELEAEHDDNDLLVLRSPSKMSPWTVMLRRPDEKEFRFYRAMAKRGDDGANENLLRRIVVFPKPAELDALFKRYSFLSSGIVDSSAFKEFLGLAVEADTKG